MTDTPPTGTAPDAASSTDALVPQAIARRAEQVGAAKARMDTVKLLSLAVLAGAFIALGAAPETFPTLDLAGLAANLIPVTLGNMVGGGVLVGAVYWFIYLRERR